jgi:hypothetical protein
MLELNLSIFAKSNLMYKKTAHDLNAPISLTHCVLVQSDLLALWKAQKLHNKSDSTYSSIISLLNTYVGFQSHKVCH